MKIKKLLATVLVAICAFMLVGCGQMTAKESVETAVSNATDIQTSATTIANGGNATPGAAAFAVTFDSDFDLGDMFGDLSGLDQMEDLLVFMEQVEAKTEAAMEIAEAMMTKVVAFGTEVVELANLAPKFLAKYETLETIITEADIAKLSKQAYVLKDVKEEFEWMVKDFQAKAEEMQSSMVDMEKLESDNIQEVLDALESIDTNKIISVFDWLIEKTVDAAERMVDVTTAITAINDILANYVEPTL